MIQLLVQSDQSLITLLPTDELSNATVVTLVVAVGSIVYYSIMLFHILDLRRYTFKLRQLYAVDAVAMPIAMQWMTPLMGFKTMVSIKV